MNVKRAEYVKPANAEGGFYVQIDSIPADNQDAFVDAVQLANDTARKSGYRVDDRARMTVGIPVWHRETHTYTQSFWYHQR